MDACCSATCWPGRLLHWTTSDISILSWTLLTLLAGQKGMQQQHDAIRLFFYHMSFFILIIFSPLFIWSTLFLHRLPFGRSCCTRKFYLTYVQCMQTLCPSIEILSFGLSIAWNKPTAYIHCRNFHGTLSNHRVNASCAHIVPLNKWVISSLCILNNLLMSRAVFTLISFQMLISLFIWTYKPWTLYK